KSTEKVQENGPNSRTVGGIVGPKSTATPAAGAAAPAADTPAGPAPLKQNETINYEVSKSIKHISNPVGKIERVSVAVILDSQTTTTTTPEGKTETKITPRTPEEMKKYKDLVSAAI